MWATYAHSTAARQEEHTPPCPAEEPPILFMYKKNALSLILTTLTHLFQMTIDLFPIMLAFNLLWSSSVQVC